MENAYGIGVKNRYELFYDEDVDPLEILRQQEEEKVKKKTDKSYVKEKNKSSKPGKPIITNVPSKNAKENFPVSQTKPTESTDKTKVRTFERVEHRIKGSSGFDDSKEFEEKRYLRNKEDNQVGSDARDSSDSDVRRGRGGFRGRGRSRGRGNHFNNFEGRPPFRRNFDRYSNSDKPGFQPAVKRESTDSNSWSDMKKDTWNTESDTWNNEELEKATEKSTISVWKDENNENQCPSDEPVKEKSNDNVAENTESKENEPVDQPIETAKEMTLDEWKREQEAKRVVPKYNLRKPGEGEDGNQWKKLYMLKKKANEEDDEEEDDDIDDEFGRRGRHRQLVDIQINFNDSRRGRGGRGRGGPRGIGPRSGGTAGKDSQHERPERRDDAAGLSTTRSFGRGGGRGYKSGQQSAPRVDDWNDFPSLVS